VREKEKREKKKGGKARAFLGTGILKEGVPVLSAEGEKGGDGVAG